MTDLASGLLCICGHPDDTHHHLDHCTYERCRCRMFRPTEEETT